MTVQAEQPASEALYNVIPESEAILVAKDFLISWQRHPTGTGRMHARHHLLS